MNRNRTSLCLWIVLGSIVFAATGMQLVGNARGNIDAPVVQLRGQSPDDETVEAIVVDLDVDRETDTSRGDMGNLVLYLAIFMLAIFVGFEVITKVPPTLHTPLMSGSNAISGITLVGAIIVAGAGWGFGSVIGMLAVALAMINVVGGFLVTHRMLSMFHAKKKA